jgi:hypothetical protein
VAAHRLKLVLNPCERFSGFIYEKARLCQESRTIEIEMRPRRGCKRVCSGCHERGTTYDHLSVRRFEFVPLWGFMSEDLTAAIALLECAEEKLFNRVPREEFASPT